MKRNNHFQVGSTAVIVLILHLLLNFKIKLLQGKKGGRVFSTK